MRSLLRADNVRVLRHGRAILDGVSLDVAPGELIALVGPNGAGKSTLLGVLAGDITPDAGTVHLRDQPVSAYPVRRLARERAVLPQRSSLAFGFRARDVVAMGRTPWHRTPTAHDDDRIIDQALAATNTITLADRLYPTLSGGEQGRIGFARVVAQQTPLMLLDEPTAALDLRHQEELLELARRSADSGVGVVAVLHDLASAAAYADRICLLHQGRIHGLGAPADVLTESLLEQVYQHPVHVITHGDRLLVVPRRRAR